MTAASRARLSMAPRITAAVLAVLVVDACARRGPPAPLVDHSRQSSPAPAAPVVARAPQPVPQPVPAAPLRGVHFVEEGDSVYSIARAYGVTLRAVIDANELTPPYLLYVDTRLAIPPPRVHVVRPGESIYSVSRQYAVDMTTLVRLNQIDRPHTIFVGQRLVVPKSADDRPPQLQVADGPAPRPSTNKIGTRLAPITAPPPMIGDDFLTPVSGPVASTFGAKEDGLHNDGINIAAARGTPVRAAQSGVVAYADENIRGYGKLILIKHADGFVTAYAHNDRLLVERGDVVGRGQVVATVGSTGGAPTPQLHFEIRRGARAVNPGAYLAAAG